MDIDQRPAKRYGFPTLAGKVPRPVCLCRVEKALRNDAGPPGACCHTCLLPGRYLYHADHAF